MWLRVVLAVVQKLTPGREEECPHPRHQHVASIEHVQPLQVNKFLKVNYYNIFIKAQFGISHN